MHYFSIAMSAAVLAGLLGACGGGGSDPPPPSTQFCNPELVTITGYPGDVMEPFISRDGSTLFFNDEGGPTDPTEKDLYYATFVDATTFAYQGPLNINTAAVDGVPTMDDNGKFYYVSTIDYDPPGNKFDTLYTGDWTGTTVDNPTVVADLADPTPGAVNFDLEVNPDGDTLYFIDGTFSVSGGAVPVSADIVIAVDSGGGFARLLDSATILANVNTSELEYAPAISRDGLELFFTRLDLATLEAGIYRTRRSSTSSAFGVPERITAIEGFVEGPTLSPDEKSLYYHRKNPTTNKFELYRVTRPGK